MDYAVLIPALPLAGFLLLVALGRRLGEPGAGWLATGAIAASFVTTVAAYLDLLGREAEARSVTVELFDWIPAVGVKVAVLLDPLSLTMALFVTGVGTLIHLYAIGYMHADRDFSRFFVYLNLFAFSMLVLVLADSYLLMFVGWEGVGVCSYLLISFWFDRETAAVAGKKAFVTNRIGDVGLLLAMFLMFQHVGTVGYGAVFARVEGLSEGTATAIVLLLLVGAAGKSAQLPLHVWLPDAMEGPTPVSALIHAATMVTAGVYLMARSTPILEMAPDATTVIAILGAATALYAATVACAQNDIKRVLAYSTVSQLGYMFLAIGSGVAVAAVFHMITHAFFKALLFLGAGSVIHGMGGEQDMKRMGGLQRVMPITAATFIIGWLAIAGVPPFAGFWSKDEVLAAAWSKHVGLWAVGWVTAGLTAYYMSRQVYLVFFGGPRWAGQEHATEAHATEAHGAHPHESPPTMWVPLVVLAGLSVVGGLLNLPFGDSLHFLEKWLEPVIPAHHAETPNSTLVALAGVTLALAAVGIVIARTWLARPSNEALEPAVLERAWGIDDGVAALVGGPGRAGADAAVTVDRSVVDGAVNGVATLVRSAGSNLRAVQSGYVRNYAAGVALGAVVLLGWVIVRGSL